MDRSDFAVPVWAEDVSPEEWAQKGRVNDPEAWEIVQQWIDVYTSTWRKKPRPPGLVLLGPPGTGKTYLAATILNLTGQWGGTTAFIQDGQVNPLLFSHQRGFDTDGLVEHLTRLGCVVWDDILRLGGNQPLTEWFLRQRFDNGLTTIITINNEVEIPPAMLSFLDPFTWITFSGKDLRAER